MPDIRIQPPTNHLPQPLQHSNISSAKSCSAARSNVRRASPAAARCNRSRNPSYTLQYRNKQMTKNKNRTGSLGQFGYDACESPKMRPRKLSAFELVSPYKEQAEKPKQRKSSAHEIDWRWRILKSRSSTSSKQKDSGDEQRSQKSKSRKNSLQDRPSTPQTPVRTRRATLGELFPRRGSLERCDSDSSLSSTGSTGTGMSWSVLKKVWKEKKQSRIHELRDQESPDEGAKIKSPGIFRRLLYNKDTLEDSVYTSIVDQDTCTLQRILGQDRIDIDHMRTPGVSLLHVACAIGNVDSVKLLLEHGANFNLITGSGMSPVQIAAIYGNFEAAQLLLSRGADPEGVRNGLQFEQSRLPLLVR